MKILALDPATKCGWAHSCGISGTWDLSVRRDESSGMRLLRLRGKLAAVKESEGVDLVVFEAARNAAPGMQGALVACTEFQATIKLWCHDNGVEYRGYSPAEIKRFATGKGMAGKPAMKEAALARWSLEYRVDNMDDNEIDAGWLLRLAISEYTERTKDDERTDTADRRTGTA